MSTWPQHAIDACKFLLYKPVSEDSTSDTRELRDWGMEWGECVDAFFVVMNGAGFPVSITLWEIGKA